jgi:hypothetical protein
MQVPFSTIILAILLGSAVSCKKEEYFKQSTGAATADAEALVESAEDVNAMAEEALQVAAELSTTEIDPANENPELAQALSQIDTSFLANLDHNAIVEKVFTKLDTNSDQSLSAEEVNAAISSIASSLGTVDESKLANIVGYVFGNAKGSHDLATVRPRLGGLLKNKTFYKLRARKRMVDFANSRCRKSHTAPNIDTSLGLVGISKEDACKRKPYREINRYMRPFPDTASFREAMRQTSSKPELHEYFAKMQDSMRTVAAKIDAACSRNEASETKNENVTRMCKIRKLNHELPHFSGVDYNLSPQE